ncbi:Zinc finger, CCHC-type [Parasponia andersonii]|uniref:Zinc finger, CCHC-type n=1 Tax=Parasponia andersonii TaxID=3476 RepID=A0A2P5E4Z3_PARAD|nr:Zinc finger, CCHC-type [Parasponia andersonii]
MRIEDLVLRLRIEEDNKRSKKNRTNSSSEAKVNIVEHGQSSKSKKNKSSKGNKLRLKGGISKKQKFQRKCFNCEKRGHKALDYRLPKKKKNEANIVDEITQDVSDIDLCIVISKMNLFGYNSKEWWPDIDATRHVCSDKICSLPSNCLRIGKIYLWEILQHPLLKAKERWF